MTENRLSALENSRWPRMWVWHATGYSSPVYHVIKALVLKTSPACGPRYKPNPVDPLENTTLTHPGAQGSPER